MAINPGTSGYRLLVDGQLVGTFAYGSGTTTQQISVAGDGQSHTFIAEDLDDPNCTATTSLTTTDCSIPCSLSNASTGLFGQKFFTRAGQISFHSDAPLEKIEADNATVSSVIDTETNRLQFAALIKAFQFEKALMQEHFNENYMESSKYPKATFAGTFTDASSVNWGTDGTYETEVKGELTIHGVTNEVTAPAILEIKDGKIMATSTFVVAVADYCAIQPADRNFAFRVRMNSFQGFNSALQREHFNENYLESSVYPEAIFQGTIIEQVNLSQPGTYTVRAKGKLLVHGVYQERIIKSRVVSDGKILRISSTFSIPLDDHDIEMPRIVNQKIAKEILVVVAATLAIKS